MLGSQQEYKQDFVRMVYVFLTFSEWYFIVGALLQSVCLVQPNCLKAENSKTHCTANILFMYVHNFAYSVGFYVVLCCQSGGFLPLLFV